MFSRRNVDKKGFFLEGGRGSVGGKREKKRGKKFKRVRGRERCREAITLLFFFSVLHKMGNLGKILDLKKRKRFIIFMPKNLP